MKLSDALKASRTLCQAVNRSGKYDLLVVENDDSLFGTGKDTRWYSLNMMRDLTTRRYYEPIYASHLGLADIEGFLYQSNHHPPTHDINPEAWEPVQ
ncbi:MAG TPA: hypothetical protein VH593_00515 [Ktedonobacteraceae bacterium]